MRLRTTWTVVQPPLLAEETTTGPVFYGIVVIVVRSSKSFSLASERFERASYFELVEARKDTTVVLHPLSDHRRVLPIERTGELLQAHTDFMLVISYNPGYQHMMKGLKPSTRQRFVGLSFDYPKAEQELVIVSRQSGIDPQTARQLVALGNDLRRLTDHDLEEAASTRLLIYTALMINSGLSAKEACRACLVEPLTDDSETRLALERLIDAHFWSL